MIDKIEKNHAEVVFLYDMLNEKQAEIQKLIHEADSSKVQFQDELAKSYQNVKDIVDPVVVSGKDAKKTGNEQSDSGLSEEDYDRIMNVNLKGVFFMIRNYANYMCENHIKGNICVVSSISAHRDLLSVYQISKNAISGIVHAYGKFLCEKGIVLNCVEPGTTDGGMLKYLAAYTDGIREGKPWNDNSIRRVIRPEEIAEVISFLISEVGEVMSGTCLLAGGGCKSIAR